MVPRVAVLIPCFNEGPAIARVVKEMADALPEATIYVYDNNSTDDTVEQATTAGAVVRRESRQGKGNVVRRMFADIEADVYVMTDGDDTYHAPSSRMMVDRLLDDGLDMVTGSRAPVDDDVHRRGHTAGNAAFTGLLRILFGGDFTDVFSGYRVMSRRFVKSFPVRSDGFEIETELCAHSQEISAATIEVPTPFQERPDGTESKLRTGRDGMRILFSALRLFENMRPLQFFGGLALALTVVALTLGFSIFEEFRRTGLVPRYPTAILAAAIQTVAFICATAGVILKSVQTARQESRRLAYLSYPAPGRPND